MGYRINKKIKTKKFLNNFTNTDDLILYIAHNLHYESFVKENVARYFRLSGIEDKIFFIITGKIAVRARELCEVGSIISHIHDSPISIIFIDIDFMRKNTQMNDDQLQSIILHETAHGVFRALTNKKDSEVFSFKALIKTLGSFESSKLLLKITEECFCDLFRSLIYKENTNDIMIDLLDNIRDFLKDNIPTNSILNLPISPKVEVDIRREVLRRVSKEIDFIEYGHPFNNGKFIKLIDLLMDMVIYVILEKKGSFTKEDSSKLVKDSFKEINRMVYNRLDN